MPSYLPRHEIRCRAALLAMTLATREAKIYHMISQNFCQNP
jgi:hypothetical protein